MATGLLSKVDFTVKWLQVAVCQMSHGKLQVNAQGGRLVCKDTVP